MSTDLTLAAAYLDRHPQMAVRVLQELPESELRAFLETATPERQDLVLRSIVPEAAAAVVASLPAEVRGQALARMPLDVAARLLRCLDEDSRVAMMAPMAAPRRRRLERAARFGEDTAGGLADPDPPTIMDHEDAAAALKHSYKRAPDLPYVFVTDRERRLSGVVSKRGLGRAVPGLPVSAVMTRDVESLSAFAPLAALLSHPAWQEVDVLPVVDGSGVLVGVLTHRALRRRLGGSGASASHSPVTSGAVALGSAYCDLLARALVSLTTAPPQRPATTAGGAP